MSVENYLNEQEEIKYKWDLVDKEDPTKRNILGITNKRVFHFKTYKRERTYRDVPLDKIEYIENKWLGRHKLKLVFGIIFLIVGVIFIFYAFQFLTGLYPVFPLFLIFVIIGIILSVIGIKLLINGLKQYGYLMINRDRWKFQFSKSSDITKIEDFISTVYFILQ